jgi:ABC-type lipoprotein export system ATPase subunit
LGDAARLLVDGVGVSLGGQKIIEDVSFEVGAGEAVAVVGKTGSGKSTLLACVMGLLRPRRGAVFWNGVNVTRTGANQLAKLRRASRTLVLSHHLGDGCVSASWGQLCLRSC